MRHPFLISILAAVLTTSVVACPQESEDVAQAARLLEHLRHRKMKFDPDGHVWYLDLSEQDAVSDGTLAAVRHLPYLREVYLIYCPIKGDGLAHLSVLNRIEKLDLYATHIDDKALEHVAKLPTLKYLDIRSVGVNDKGFTKSVHGFISDDGIKLVSDTLPNLESLLCSGTVTDDGLRHLVKLKKLRYVEIGSPNVSSEGIKWLQNAMPNLEIDW